MRALPLVVRPEGIDGSQRGSEGSDHYLSESSQALKPEISNVIIVRNCLNFVPLNNVITNKKENSEFTEFFLKKLLINLNHN